METDKKTPTNIIRSYQRYLKLQRGYSPNTLDAYIRDLLKLINYLEDVDKHVVDVELSDLQHFAASLHDIGIHPRSQCRILSGVRSFFRFLELEGYRDDDPSELLESPVLGEHLPEVLSAEEVDMLEGAIDLSKWEGQRNRAIIEVLFSCGLRVSELVNLKLSDLFLQENHLTACHQRVGLLVYGPPRDEDKAWRGGLCVSEQAWRASDACHDTHHD